MGKETKIGLVVVAVVAGFFGVFVVGRFRQNPSTPQVAQSESQQLEAVEPLPQSLEPPPVVVETSAFSTDMTSHEEADELAYPADESLLDVPPGDDVLTEYAPAESSPEPSARRQDRAALSGALSGENEWDVVDEQAAPQHDGMVELAGPSHALREHSASSSDDEQMLPIAEPAGPSWQSSADRRTHTGAPRQDTAVVDDLRNAAADAETLDAPANLFDTSATPSQTATTAVPSQDSARPHDARVIGAPPGTRQWIVQEGDTFWTISRERYGSGRYFQALARWNEKTVPDPQRMRLGTVVETPPLALLEQAHLSLVHKKAASTTGRTQDLEGLSVPEQPGAFADALGQKYYHVGRTDTLFDISKKTLGSGGRWNELFELNHDVLEDPDRLAPGMILRLPASATVRRLLSSRPETGVIR